MNGALVVSLLVDEADELLLVVHEQVVDPHEPLVLVQHVEAVGQVPHRPHRRVAVRVHPRYRRVLDL